MDKQIYDPKKAHWEKIKNDPVLHQEWKDKKKTYNKSRTNKVKQRDQERESLLQAKDERIKQLEESEKKLQEQVGSLQKQLAAKEAIIAQLKDKPQQPDNQMTVECYRKIQQGKAFDASCISQQAHEIELKKAFSFIQKISFGDIPKDIQKDRKIIFLGMEGACRHYRPLKGQFRGYRIIAVDSSQSMLNFGAKHYSVPKSDLICSTVQNFDYQIFKYKISLCFCWWNACYLSDVDLKQYLMNMMMTLRCPQNEKVKKAPRNPPGYILLAEPTGNESSINDFKGQSMAIRPVNHYEKIFCELGLEICAKEDYPSYWANSKIKMNEERVWLLRENKQLASQNPTQRSLHQIFQKNKQAKREADEQIKRADTLSEVRLSEKSLVLQPGVNQQNSKADRDSIISKREQKQKEKGELTDKNFKNMRPELLNGIGPLEQVTIDPLPSIGSIKSDINDIQLKDKIDIELEDQNV